MRIGFVGHVSKDVNVVAGAASVLYGGGVVHGAITAARLGAQATVYTKCADVDRSFFAVLSDAGVDVVFLPSATTTSIQNEYPTDNPDDRNSRILSRAEPFTVEDLEVIDTDIVHVNALWHGEFPPHLLADLRDRPNATTLGADAQGLFRHVLADGRMVHRDWDGKDTHLPHVDLFKVDLSEARILTGLDDPRGAARALCDMGATTTVLTHKSGVCVCDGHEHYEADFTGYTNEGRTGRGDTCTAAFLVASETMDIGAAVDFAAEVTSRKMQYPGPFRGV